MSRGRGDIDALVFDFGGVIIEIDFDRVFARWAELSGVAFDEVKARFSHGEAYQGHERGTLDERGFYQSLRDSIGLDLTDAQFADGWARVLGDEIAPTVALLPRLAQRLPCYLFSNTNFAHYALWGKRHARALAPFRARFISCEMGCRKPDAEAFGHVAQAIGVARAHPLLRRHEGEHRRRARGRPAGGLGPDPRRYPRSGGALAGMTR